MIHLSVDHLPVLGAKRSARAEDLGNFKLLQDCLNDQQPTDRWGAKAARWTHGSLNMMSSDHQMECQDLLVANSIRLAEPVPCCWHMVAEGALDTGRRGST